MGKTIGWGNVGAGKTVGACILTLFFLAVTVSAIPDAEIYNFKASVTGEFKFDEYNPTNNNFSITRTVQLYTFFNESQYYYVIIRANPADVSPYDEFDIEFFCDGESHAIFTTTDYTSWVESGQISFKKQFTSTASRSYGNSTLYANFGYCTVVSASGLVVDGNVGYTTFRLDLVPVTTGVVTTLESYCEEEALSDTITAELSAIDTIFTTNVNFLTTLFTVFQIIALVFVVLAIPIMMFMLIKFVIWKITGIRILDKRVE